MRNYKLQIELTFLAESEARDIMSACSDLLKSTDKERDIALIKKLEAQVIESTSHIQGIIDKALSQRPAITRFLNDANAIIAGMRESKKECVDCFSGLEQRANELISKIKDDSKGVEGFTRSAEVAVEATFNKLTELDRAIKEACHRAEACQFINDINKVSKSILTGGQVTLIAPDDLGNPAVKEKWEV